MMKVTSLLAITALALPVAAHAALEVPNFSFEEGGMDQYGTPPQWTEDQDRTTTNFGNSGRVEDEGTDYSNETPPLTAYDGDLMARVSIAGDSDPNTDFLGTLSTTLEANYAADTVYTLSFQTARAAYVTPGEWYAVGGFRANGSEVAFEEMDLQQYDEDTWNEFTVTFDTTGMSAVEDQPIEIFFGMRHEGDNFKSIFFDDVSVVPEPSTYALGLGGLALAFAAIRRRK